MDILIGRSCCAFNVVEYMAQLQNVKSLYAYNVMCVIMNDESIKVLSIGAVCSTTIGRSSLSSASIEYPGYLYVRKENKSIGEELPTWFDGK